MKIDEIIKLYCIGIGGIGVSAVARLFLARGIAVSGSDIRDSATIQELIKLGAKINIGHNSDNLDADANLVIHTEDVNETSPGMVELSRARELGIQTRTYSQMVGLMMEGKKGIGVSGTNGKSTTTAILGLIAEKANLDPTVIVGSKVPLLPGSTFTANARAGQSDLFIVEADEYHRHMLDARPWAAAITNISADHLDYYKNLEDIKSAFVEYIQALPPDGLLVFNLDDANSVEVGSEAKCSKLCFGFTPQADLFASEIIVKDGKQDFNLTYKKESIGEFNLKVPGKHNLANAMAATLVALNIGASPDQIRESLAEYPGIWRRFEILNDSDGKIIISDYAHHPDGITKTLEAAKEFYPGKKILTVFQPHQKSRTHALYDEFLTSLKDCDGLVLLEIFSVVGREKVDFEISSRSMIEKLSSSVPDIEFAEYLEQAETAVKNRLKDYDIVLFMGAGDIDSVARHFAR